MLTGKRSVSDETKDRVNRAIEELGYHPNAGARALRSSRSNVLALIVPLRNDMYVPVMMEIATGVVTQARGHGYDVLLLTNDEGSDGIRPRRRTTDAPDGRRQRGRGLLAPAVAHRPGQHRPPPHLIPGQPP